MERNIVIVYGGESCEHDISVITALSAYHAVKRRFHTALIYLKDGRFFIGEGLSDVSAYVEFQEKKYTEIVFSNGGYAPLKKPKKKKRVDCALICNHGGEGENGSLTGFFNLVRIPCTASGVLGSSICMDKVFTKFLLEKFKFPVLPYRVYRKGYQLERMEELGYPLIIKPARLGSSVGIGYAKDREELIKALEFSLQFDDKLLVERALTDFAEFNCAAVTVNGKAVVSDIEKPIFQKEYLDFDDKYLSDGDAKRELPANIPKKLKDKIENFTRDIYLMFDLSGVVRVDYLYEKEKLYVNEINTVPGSLSAYLFREKGISPEQLYTEMIEDAIQSAIQKTEIFTDFTSEVLKHFSGSKGGGMLGIKK